MDSPAPTARPPWAFGGLAFGLCVAALALDRALPRRAPAWLDVAGTLALLVSIPFVFLPFRQLARYGAAPRGSRYMDTTRVADRGLYGLVRHPQYLGYALLLGGFACKSAHPVILAVAAGSILAFRWQALSEERVLAERFGAAWESYAGRVPRFNLLLGLVRRLRERGR